MMRFDMQRVSSVASRSKQRLVRALVLATALGTAANMGWAQSARGASSPPENLSALPFASLSDQFGRTIDSQVLQGRAVVLLVADKEGSDGQRVWLPALRTALPASVVVLAAADLVGAPRLLRGVIRSGFPKDSSARILLDWDGRVARRVRGERDHLVAVIFAPDGSLRERIALPLDAVADEVRNRIRAASSP